VFNTYSIYQYYLAFVFNFPFYLALMFNCFYLTLLICRRHLCYLTALALNPRILVYYMCLWFCTGRVNIVQ